MPAILTDNFNDNVIDTAKWDVAALDNFNAGVTVVETGDQLVITPLASTASSNFNGLTSDATFNITQGFAIWKLEQMAINGAVTRCGVFLDANNWVGFQVTPSVLTFRKRASSTDSNTTTIYDSTNHKYLMLHHCGARVNWYISPNGLTWTAWRTGVEPEFTVTEVKLFLDAGTTGSVATPGTAIFDDVEIGTLDIEAAFELQAGFSGYVDLIIDPGFPLNIDLTGGGGETNIFTIPTQRRYSGSRVFAAVSNLLSWRQEATGSIISIDLWCQQNTHATSAIFNLRKNGESVLAGASRLIVPNGSASVSRSGLSIAAELGDQIDLSIEQIPPTGIGTPITVLVRTQVG